MKKELEGEEGGKGSGEGREVEGEEEREEGKKGKKEGEKVRGRKERGKKERGRREGRGMIKGGGGGGTAINRMTPGRIAEPKYTQKTQAVGCVPPHLKNML